MKHNKFAVFFYTLLAAFMIAYPAYAIRIDVATMAVGERYQEITYPCSLNKANYCKKHGYQLHLYKESLDVPRPIPWTKILILLQIMENPEVDWIFWTDADSLIMNHDIKLGTFIDERYDMIITADWNGINTGQFLIRNCKWAKEFLELVYANTEFIDHDWWEQMAMMDQLAHSEEDQKHLKILQQREFNSYAPGMFQDPQVYYQEGDFIIHFAGMRGGKLIDLINHYSVMCASRQNLIGP